MIKFLLFLTVVGTAGYFGWEFVSGGGMGTSNGGWGAHRYPIERTLTSADGRKLDSVILGKKGDLLYLRRKSDGREFELDSNKLSADDAAYAASLPSVPPPLGPLVWQTDYAKAQKEAGRRNLPIFLLFDGTGW